MKVDIAGGKKRKGEGGRGTAKSEGTTAPCQLQSRSFCHIRAWQPRVVSPCVLPHVQVTAQTVICTQCHCYEWARLLPHSRLSG
jgi:hypothetical protein